MGGNERELTDLEKIKNENNKHQVLKKIFKKFRKISTFKSFVQKFVKKENKKYFKK